MRLTIEEHRESLKRYRHIRPASGLGVRPCSARCPGTKRTCTLARDHRGPHVAHGAFKRVVAVWDSGSGVSVSGASERRAAEARSRRSVRGTGSGGVLGRAWSYLRTVSSFEELALLVFFLAFVGFAIEWLLLILR